MIIAWACGTKPVMIEWFKCIGVVFLFCLVHVLGGLRIIRTDRGEEVLQNHG